MLRDHGDTNGRSWARNRLEAGPEEVQEPKPDQGNGRHRPTVADPVMHRSDRRPCMSSYRSERKHHPYRSSGHLQSRREHPTHTQHGPEIEDWMARSFCECLRRELAERGIAGRVTSPFTREIEIAITLMDWKMPSMEPYKGIFDSIIHLQRYTQHMLMSGATEGVLCKCFHLFLSDLATTWFCRLPQGSISSWEMLKEKFINQFRIHIEQPKDAYSLSSIKQKSDESFQQYLTRFNAAAAAVQVADEKLILMALCSGVHPDTKFAKRPTKEKPSTLPEFFHEARKYMRLEDMITERQTGQTSKSVKARAGSNTMTKGPNNRQGEEPKGASQDNVRGKRKERR